MYDLVSRLGEPLLYAGMHGVWEMGADLGGMSGKEVSERVNDDRVLKACFFAQILWSYANDDLTRNIIAMSILTGSPHPSLEEHAPVFARHIHEIINILTSCQEYVFEACPGFNTLLHTIHIADESMYEEWRQAGFCPFTKSNSSCHTMYVKS